MLPEANNWRISLAGVEYLGGMEKDIKIKVDGTHAVYGKFRGKLSQPLIVHVHGLPGDIYDSLASDAMHWFATHGFAVYRFGLYDWRGDSRQLIDCTLRTHANDLDAIVKHFRKKGAKNVFVVGHSFGGPTILLSKKQAFDAAALWDPSYDISFTKEKYGYPGGKFIKELNGYFMRWGANVIIGKAMADEVDNLQWSDLPKSFKKPLKVIAAGKGVLVKGCNDYFAAATEPKNLTVIKGATHYFDDTPEIRNKLYRETKRWFDRFYD